MNLMDYYKRLPRQTSPKSAFVKEIMDACGVSFTTAMNWVSGKTKPLYSSNLDALSKLTGIKKEDLFL